MTYKVNQLSQTEHLGISPSYSSKQAGDLTPEKPINIAKTIFRDAKNLALSLGYRLNY